MSRRAAHSLSGSALVWVVLVLYLLTLLAACSGAPKKPPATDPQAANTVLMRALGLVGTPYRYGGNTPAGGFDCSGLVGFVFLDAAGIHLPRRAEEIGRLPAAALSRQQLAAGDLVLFGDGGRVDHVGIYVGDARFVHAPSQGGTVRLDPLDSRYWQQRFLGGRRVLR